MEIATNVIVSFLSSGAAIAVVLYIGKGVIDGYIKKIFRRRELEFEKHLATLESNAQTLFQKELTVYPEVTEIVYRTRNAARACMDDPPPIASVSDYGACRIHIVENLYKYRLFFPDDVFRNLHRYKTLAQEFGVLLDEVTRSLEVDDAPVDPEIRVIAYIQMARKYAELNNLYEELSAAIRSFILEKTSRADKNKIT
jgi:hypothetical protein